MTIKQQIKVRKHMRTAAQKEGITVAEFRKGVQEAIDEAWANQTAESSAAWIRYFPDGKKPSVEEFIDRMASVVRMANLMKKK